TCALPICPRSRAGPRQSASPARSCARHALDQHDVIRIKLKVLNVGLVRSGARSMRLFTEAPRTRSVPASLAAMGRLVSPYGLVSKLTPLPIREGEPFYSVVTGSLGNPGAVLAAHPDWEHDPSAGNFDGAGGSVGPEIAAHLAIAESLERYSSCAWHPDAMIWATADELGEDAIPPTSWPNLSSAEYADPKCGLV